VSDIKSKWVGDSEKNIQQLFDDYRQLVAQSDVAPILLFNEADAVIGRRREGADNAVEKMENAIQNIILQEMERLDGILIATTNLTENLDRAFERRFLYKIEFHHPSTEAMKHIWQTMLPELSAEDAAQLSEAYNLSGGQIENISRKHIVDTILSGSQVTLEKLQTYCREELSFSNKGTHRIGFI
ncbi:MAG: ATP-binding protein, partial [Prevotella sp.]|nr:ATP-binding protein [Prevotella sp.]